MAMVTSAVYKLVSPARVALDTLAQLVSERSGYATIALRVGRFEVVADEIIDLLLARVRRTHIPDVLTERLVIGRIFAALGTGGAPIIVLLADIRIVGCQFLECCRLSSATLLKVADA
jgi:hypothetical protein